MDHRESDYLEGEMEMNKSDFEAWMKEHWAQNSKPHHNDTFYLAACAQGEAGELFKVFKKQCKIQGTNNPKLTAKELHEAILEAGDTIHYVIRLMQVLGVDLYTVLAYNKDKIEKRYSKNPDWTVG